MAFVTGQEQFRKTMSFYRDIINSQESCWEKASKITYRLTFGECSHKNQEAKEAIGPEHKAEGTEEGCVERKRAILICTFGLNALRYIVFL